MTIDMPVAMRTPVHGRSASWSRRVTFEELEEVAANARARASMLARGTDHHPARGTNAAELEREAELLFVIAEELDRLVDRLVGAFQDRRANRDGTDV